MTYLTVVLLSNDKSKTLRKISDHAGAKLSIVGSQNIGGSNIVEYVAGDTIVVRSNEPGAATAESMSEWKDWLGGI